MQERIALGGQVVVVTGGGAGLGRAYARELARRGAAVVVNDVAADTTEAVVAEIEREGGRAVPVVADVATPVGGRAIVDAAVDSFGTVDAVIANAGIMRPEYFEDVEPETLQQTLAVNLEGVFYVTQAAWPIMREKGYGRVALVSSGGGITGMQAQSSYAASKGGVFALARTLAFEGREHGILVNTVLPGAATDMGRKNPVPDYDKHMREELRAGLLPLRVAEGVAALVAYLVSPACSVTGEAFSSMAGRVSMAFLGFTDGWVGHHAEMTAEDVAEHIDEIRDRSGYHASADFWQEYEALATRLGIG
jgi:NAD(P)-dependent dehydrogenase (short-subunit alcohol dehydrogenase family)